MDEEGMNRTYDDRAHVAPIADVFVEPPTKSRSKQPAGTWVGW
jgi:hypothetical protein